MKIFEASPLFVYLLFFGFVQTEVKNGIEKLKESYENITRKIGKLF